MFLRCCGTCKNRGARRSYNRYARALKRPAIYGATKESERQAVLGSFRFNPAVNTVCLSKVGDVAIDLPEANVIARRRAEAI